MRKSIALLLALVFLTALCYVSPLPASAAPKTIVVPDDYASIQVAIDSASEGDTILIRNGTYTEQTLAINKSLTITSEYDNGARISLHPPQFPVNYYSAIIMFYNNSIRIDADDVKFSGCNFTSDGGDISANGNRIQIINNTIGTKRTAISVYITGNGSQALGNTMAGLIVAGSNNMVRENHAASISVTGSFNFILNNDAGSIALIGSNNLVDGNSFIESGGVGIWIIDAYYNTITNNIEVGSTVGIAIGYANPGGSNNVFAGNTVEACNMGILVGNGSGNVFYGNRIANNSGYGLALGGYGIEADNNLFFHNIFENNAQNFGTNWDITGSNSFDNGAEGNYWDDYLIKYPDASEIGHSGVWDTPYLVYANTADNYPLMNEPDVSSIVPALPSPAPSPSPEATPSPSTSPSPSPSPEPQPETFLTLLVVAASIAVIIVVAAGLLVYNKKRKREERQT